MDVTRCADLMHTLLQCLLTLSVSPYLETSKEGAPWGAFNCQLAAANAKVGVDINGGAKC